MNPQDVLGSGVQPTINNPLSVERPGEQTVCEIKRHPVGILGIYIMSGCLLVMLAVVIFLLAPSVFNTYSRSQVTAIGALVFVVVAALVVGFLFIAKKVYWGNSWVVTTNGITQIKRITLFDKQTSQLSFGNLEDVTAEQDSMWQQMFHYGVISAETAAATDKFTFTYCPNPNYYVQKILEAREVFEETRQRAAAAAPPAAPVGVPANPAETAQPPQPLQEPQPTPIDNLPPPPSPAV